MYIDVIENYLNWTIPRTNSSLFNTQDLCTSRFIPNEVEMLVVGHGVLVLGAQLLYIDRGNPLHALPNTPHPNAQPCPPRTLFQHHRSPPTTLAPSELL